MKNFKFYKKKWFSILLIFIFPFINFIYIHKRKSNLFIKIILNTILSLWTCFWLLFMLVILTPNTSTKHIPNKTIISTPSYNASPNIIVPVRYMKHDRHIAHIKHDRYIKNTKRKKHIQSVQYTKPIRHIENMQTVQSNKAVQYTQPIQNAQPVQQTNSNQSNGPVLNYNIQNKNSRNSYNKLHLHRHLSHFIARHKN